MMGKRVNFSGRSVITADPTIDIDEVGVPRSLASILTFPERVTRYNIKRLTELVAHKDAWPGARFYIFVVYSLLSLFFISIDTYIKRRYDS